MYEKLKGLPQGTEPFQLSPNDGDRIAMPHTYQLGTLAITVSTPEDFALHGRACNEPGMIGLAARVEAALALAVDKCVRVTVCAASLADAERITAVYREAGWKARSVPDSK